MELRGSRLALTLEDELKSAVQVRRGARQLAAASLRPVPMRLLAEHYPVMHYYVKETLRRIDTETAAQTVAASCLHREFQAGEKVLRPNPEAEQSKSVNSRPVAVGVGESLHLVSLDVKDSEPRRRDDALDNTGSGTAEELTEQLHSRQIAQAKKVEALTTVRSLATVHTVRGFGRQLRDKHVTNEEESVLHRGDGLVGESDIAFGERLLVRALLAAASIHTDLHRVSAAHKLRLNIPTVGGPVEVKDTDATFALRAVPTLGPGCFCVFGVAPFVGVSVNHPLARSLPQISASLSRGPESADITRTAVASDTRGSLASSSSSLAVVRGDRGIESLGLVALWGSGGTLFERITKGPRVSNGMATRWLGAVAACLAALHQRGQVLGRLDAHTVSLFPRETKIPNTAKDAKQAEAAKTSAAEKSGAQPIGQSSLASLSNEPEGPRSGAATLTQRQQDKRKHRDKRAANPSSAPSRRGLEEKKGVGPARRKDDQKSGKQQQRGTRKEKKEPVEVEPKSQLGPPGAKSRPPIPLAKVCDLTRCCCVGGVSSKQEDGCPWSLRDLVRDEAYLPPAYEHGFNVSEFSVDEAGEADEAGSGSSGCRGVVASQQHPILGDESTDDDGSNTSHKDHTVPSSSSQQHMHVSVSHDLWYFGCLGLELVSKTVLASSPMPPPRGLSRKELDALIPPRFSPQVRQVILACLSREDGGGDQGLAGAEATMTAMECLELLVPKEAARLKGESLRGWAKKEQRRRRDLPPKHAGGSGGEEEEEDTDSGSESEGVGNGGDGDPENFGGGGGGNGLGGGGETESERATRLLRFRFNVPQAVQRANARVDLFQKQRWWNALASEKQANLLHRRLVRRQANTRRAFLGQCTATASFKAWGERRLGLWLRHVATVAVLAHLLEPFTAEEAAGEGDADFRTGADDDGGGAAAAAAVSSSDDATSLSSSTVEDSRKSNIEATAAAAAAKAAAAAEVGGLSKTEEPPSRREGPFFQGDELTPFEEVSPYIRTLKAAGTHYDLCEAASLNGPTPSLRVYDSGAAGVLGRKEKLEASRRARPEDLPLLERALLATSGYNPAVEAKLLLKAAAAAAGSSTTTTSTTSEGANPSAEAASGGAVAAGYAGAGGTRVVVVTIFNDKKLYPKAPLPHLFEGNPYCRSLEKSSLEWKADGASLWQAMEEAKESAAEELEELMTGTFQYEGPKAIAEMELLVSVRCVREQEALKPILERAVSVAEPQIPTQAQVERMCSLLALSLWVAFEDMTNMCDAGLHWAAARVQALARGMATRQVVAGVWQEAAMRARSVVAAQEDVERSAREDRRREMASRLHDKVLEAQGVVRLHSRGGGGGGGGGGSTFGGGRWGPVVVITGGGGHGKQDPQALFAPVVVGSKGAQARELVLGLPDLVADAVRILSRRHRRRFHLTVRVVEIADESSKRGGGERCDTDGEGGRSDGGGEVDTRLPAGLLVVTIGDAPLGPKKKGGGGGGEGGGGGGGGGGWHEADLDPFGVRFYDLTCVATNLKPDRVYLAHFLVPRLKSNTEEKALQHHRQQPRQQEGGEKGALLPSAFPGEAVDKLASTETDSCTQMEVGVDDEDEATKDDAANTLVVGRGNKEDGDDDEEGEEEEEEEDERMLAPAYLALRAENPSWVSPSKGRDDGLKVALRTLPTSPEPPTATTTTAAAVRVKVVAFLASPHLATMTSSSSLRPSAASAASASLASSSLASSALVVVAAAPLSRADSLPNLLQSPSSTTTMTTTTTTTGGSGGGSAGGGVESSSSRLVIDRRQRRVSSVSGSGAGSSSRGGSSLSSKRGGGGKQAVAHISWNKCAQDNGAGVEAYRVQRCLRLAAFLPTSYPAAVSTLSSASATQEPKKARSDAQEKSSGGSSARRSTSTLATGQAERASPVLLQRVATSWVVVHETASGDVCEWSDLLHHPSSDSNGQTALDRQISELSSLSQAAADESSSRVESRSTRGGGSNEEEVVAAFSSETTKSSQAASAVASAGVVPSPSRKAVVLSSSERRESRGKGKPRHDDTSSEGVRRQQRGDGASGKVPPGVVVEFLFRVSAKNRFGWGAFSAPNETSSSPLPTCLNGRTGSVPGTPPPPPRSSCSLPRGCSLRGLVVSFADSDAWLSALEGSAAAATAATGSGGGGGGGGGSGAEKTTALPLLQPHQLTRGIFHNYVPLASTLHSSKGGETSDSKGVAYPALFPTSSSDGDFTPAVARSVSQAPDTGLGLSRRLGVKAGASRGTTSYTPQHGPIKVQRRALPVEVSLGRVQDEDTEVALELKRRYDMEGIQRLRQQPHEDGLQESGSL